jgi:hypothetical protein
MIYGFGTRIATNGIVENFTKSFEGIYYNNRRTVDKFETTFWPNFNIKKWIEEKNPIIVLGILRGTEKLLWLAKEHKINYYYIDHAYFFRAEKHKTNEITNEQSYRICVNCENLNFNVNKLMNEDDILRIQNNKSIIIKKISQFKGTGNKILICPPSEALIRYYKIEEGVQGWLDRTINIIKQQTDKQIVIRYKDTNTPILKDFEDAYCIVTFQSTIAIEAILNGIPSFCDISSSCASVSNTDLNISKLFIPTRDQIILWIDSLLANQFTMKEIMSGVARKSIGRLQKEKYI